MLNKLSNNLQFIKTSLIILSKKLKEYKTNMLTLAIEHIIYFSTTIFLFTLIYKNFQEITPWQLNDFILFFILLDWICAVGGIFIWKNPNLNTQITTGKLNEIFIRPKNPILNYFFSNLNQNLLIYTLINPIIHITTIILFFPTTIHNIPQSIIIWTTILICYILSHELINSFEFHQLGLSEHLKKNFQTINNSIANNYPYHFFQKIQIQKILLMIAPLFFVSSLLLPTIRNYPIQQPTTQIIILITLTITFLLVTILNWKKGIKNYNAYN